MLEEIGSPLHISAGVTHDALLSTVVACLVKHAGKAQPAGIAMAADIIRLLSASASSEALVEARQQLESSGYAFAGLVPQPVAAEETGLSRVAPDLDLDLCLQEAPDCAQDEAIPASGRMSLSSADGHDLVAEAAICGPARLVMLAQRPEVPEALSDRILARGHAEALVATVSNPSARFAKSSLTTIVELAASDVLLRQALCQRGDLPDSILDRLWPFLSQASRVTVIMAGCTTERRALTALLAEADQDLIMAVRDGELPLGIDTCLARIAQGEWTLAHAITALGQEGRIADIATLLARKACVLPVTALALLTGAYDRGLVMLARAAQADAAALEAALLARAHAGCRRTADGRGPLHALEEMSEAEAGTLLLHVAAATEATQARRAALFDIGQDEPAHQPGKGSLANKGSLAA